MAQLSEYTMKDFQKYMEAQADAMGLSGIKRRLPWNAYRNKNNQDAERMKKNLAFFEALTAAELENPKLIKGESKKRIAQATGLDAAEINELLTLYHGQTILFVVIKKQQAADEALPTNEEEGRRLMEAFQVKNPRIMRRR